MTPIYSVSIPLLIHLFYLNYFELGGQPISYTDSTITISLDNEIYCIGEYFGCWVDGVAFTEIGLDSKANIISAKLHRSYADELESFKPEKE